VAINGEWGVVELVTPRLRLRRWILGTGELAGFTGMAIPADVPEIMPGVEIGWRLGRAHWGRGVATEAATAALRFAFTDGGLDRILGIHVVGNDASARVMRKLGMRFDRETTEIVYGRPVHVYAIDRREHDRHERQP
jgi:RimJ/RimL family protein N-acetyltransferase